MIIAACRIIRLRRMLVSSSSRLEVAEGEELETNILSQDFEGLRGTSIEGAHFWADSCSIAIVRLITS